MCSFAIPFDLFLPCVDSILALFSVIVDLFVIHALSSVSLTIHSRIFFFDGLSFCPHQMQTPFVHAIYMSITSCLFVS